MCSIPSITPLETENTSSQELHPDASLFLGRARLPPPVPSLLPHASYPPTLLQFGDDRQSFVFVHHICNFVYCPPPMHSDHASHNKRFKIHSRLDTCGNGLGMRSTSCPPSPPLAPKRCSYPRERRVGEVSPSNPSHWKRKS